MNNIIRFQFGRVPYRGQSSKDLSTRESEVLALGELSGKEAAHQLGIAVATLYQHRKAIKDKLRADTWTRAVVMGRKAA